MSKLRLAVYIAMKIARSRRSATLSVVTLISIVGIACGVMALTVVLSVTDGFQAAFADKILGIFPHLVVTRTSSSFRDYEAALQTIRATEGVVGATPLTGDEMMVAHGVFRAGATVQGVDLDTVESVLDVSGLMRSGKLADLREEPVVERAAPDAWRISGPIEGVSLTLVVSDDASAPKVYTDERIVPDADHARVKLLDLRKTPGATELRPRGGAAVDTYEMKEPVPLKPGASGYGQELELPQGDWELGATGERLQLEDERAYLIVLLDAAPGAPGQPAATGPRSMLLTEPGKAVIGERQALVRVVDARPSGAPLRWFDGHGPTPFLTTQPGEQSGMASVQARLPGVLLGAALAKKLRTEVGDELTFVTPLRGIDNKMMGPYGMLPSSAHFRVVGTFEAGFYDHDVRLAIVNIAVSQRFLNRGKMVRSIAVKTESLVTLDHTKSMLKRALDPFPVDDFLGSVTDLDQSLRRLVAADASSPMAPPTADAPLLSQLGNVIDAVGLLSFHGQDSIRHARFQIFDWKEKNINLFSALELQKVVLSIFFFIIILVGSFVVVGSQIMVVHEKTPDIAILKAMGATSGLVRLVFTLQGVLVALIGLVFGLLLGVGFTALIDAVGYKLEASIYLIDHLPAKLQPAELALVALGALVCTLVTTQVSAGRAASKTIVAGLRQVD
ncbi:MAG: FtsX-like permease family protein [Myxococcota bacterium]